MNIILFIAILAILILVHELGHFLIAKKTGMRVDEFGIGFPPRLFSLKKGETTYSLNLIPFGGFVKIFGEDLGGEAKKEINNKKSMINKPKWAQALVVSAGIIFNIIFAWVLLSVGFVLGMPVSTNQFVKSQVKDAKVIVVNVLENSPAQKSGLKMGDKLLFVSAGDDFLQNFSEDEVQKFIENHPNQKLSILYGRDKAKQATAFVVPVKGLKYQGGFLEKPAIGIAMDTIGTVKFPFYKAIWEGAKMTNSLISTTAVGFFGVIKGIFIGKAKFSQIVGPIGIVGMVGEAASFGFVYLLSFIAFISVDLAIINFLPFPALDGGRLLFIIVESITRKNIKPSIINLLNFIGFGLLIILMLVITYNDILKLF